VFLGSSCVGAAGRRRDLLDLAEIREIRRRVGS